MVNLDLIEKVLDTKEEQKQKELKNRIQKMLFSVFSYKPEKVDKEDKVISNLSKRKSVNIDIGWE